MTIQTLRNLEHGMTRTSAVRNANAIAWVYKITIYDALYVGLAEQVEYPLITADEVMLKKLKGHSIVTALRQLEFKA
jgi:predicted nucleic acid-binding protein